MDFDVRTGTGLRQRTVESIGYRIIDGTYPPGHRFKNQDDLSVELGVSRTVLREALGLLRDKGLIESRPKAGTVVAAYRSWNLLDADVLRWSIASRSAPTTLTHVGEVRRIIEPEAARLAARRRSDEAAAEIVELYEAMTEVVSDYPRYIAADLAFHDAVFHAAANPMLSQMAEMVRVALEGSRRLTVHVPGGPATTLDLHSQVARAIESRDEDEAARVMTELIEVSVNDHLQRMLQAAEHDGQPADLAADWVGKLLET